MFSVECPVVAKFNVDAKPFEMFMPRREPFSSESSDSSDYGPTAPIFMAAGYADDSAHNNSSDGDGLFLDISDPISDNESSPVGSELLTDETFLSPDEELCQRIIKQVEFYFSDVNLTKDAFLLKHVKRNKEGYVSLKLISSFKKVKTLTKDWRVVAYSLKTSDKLTVNEAGTKVRRREALPPYDESTPNRTVIAMNLPFDRPTVESVTDLFSKCGDIALIRILRPGAPVPPDIKQFLSKHPGIGNCVCAVIEFIAPEAALKAVSEMGSKNNDWRSMHVIEMVKTKKDAKTNLKKDSSPKSENEDTPRKDETDKKKKRNKKRCVKTDQNKNTVDDDTSPESFSSPRGSRKCNSVSEDIIATPTTVIDPMVQMNGRLLFSPKMSPESKQRQKSASYSEGVSVNGTSSGSSPNHHNGSSPWVHRRRMAAKENGQSPLANRRVEVVSPGQNGSATKLLVPEGVIRMPKGPDGTNGFHTGFGRGRPFQEPFTSIPIMG